MSSTPTTPGPSTPTTFVDLSKFKWHQFKENQVKELYESFQMYSNKQKKEFRKEDKETISIKEMRSLIETFIGLEFSDEQMLELVNQHDPKLIEESQKQQAAQEAKQQENQQKQDEQQQPQQQQPQKQHSGGNKSLLEVQVSFQILLDILNDRFRTGDSKSGENYEKHLQELFNMFDMNENGVIGVAELGHFFKHVLGEQLSDTELAEMMKDVKTKNPGVMTFEEFKTLVQDLNIDS